MNLIRKNLNDAEKVKKLAFVFLSTLLIVYSFYTFTNNLNALRTFKKSQNRIRELLSLFPEKNYEKVWNEINSFKAYLDPKHSNVYLFPSEDFDPFLLSYPLSPILLKQINLSNKPKSRTLFIIVFKKVKSSFEREYTKWTLVAESEQFLLVQVDQQ